MSSNDKKSKRIKRLVRWIWGLFLFGIIFGILFIISVRINLGNLYGDFPSYRSLENPKNE